MVARQDGMMAKIAERIVGFRVGDEDDKYLEFVRSLDIDRRKQAQLYFLLRVAHNNGMIEAASKLRVISGNIIDNFTMNSELLTSEVNIKG